MKTVQRVPSCSMRTDGGADRQMVLMKLTVFFAIL